MTHNAIYCTFDIFITMNVFISGKTQYEFISPVLVTEVLFRNKFIFVSIIIL